jgi:hypothetical protein
VLHDIVSAVSNRKVVLLEMCIIRTVLKHSSNVVNGQEILASTTNIFIIFSKSENTSPYSVFGNQESSNKRIQSLRDLYCSKIVCGTRVCSCFYKTKQQLTCEGGLKTRVLTRICVGHSYFFLTHSNPYSYDHFEGCVLNQLPDSSQIDYRETDTESIFSKSGLSYNRRLSSAANEEIIHKGQNMEIKGRKFVCWLKQPAKTNLKIRERSKGAIYNFVHISMIQNKSKHQNGGNMTIVLLQEKQRQFLSYSK